jgi:hypothetical protein
MASNSGPKIVTSNLLVHLDVANRNNHINNSILPLTGWSPGSGGTSYFRQNGATAENERALDTTPFGNVGTVWETSPQSNHDVSGEVGKRERKKLCQLSVIIHTSAARFSSVSGPGIWREV